MTNSIIGNFCRRCSEFRLLAEVVHAADEADYAGAGQLSGSQ